MGAAIVVDVRKPPLHEVGVAGFRKFTIRISNIEWCCTVLKFQEPEEVP